MFDKLEAAHKKLYTAVSEGNANPEEQINEYNEALKEVRRTHENKVAELEAKLEQLETEKANLEESLSTAQSENEDLKNKVEEQEQAIESKDLELNTLSSEVDDLKAANIELSKETGTKPIDINTTTKDEKVTGDGHKNGKDLWAELQAKHATSEN